jgi:DNA-binding MarR family transcriptional regulator
VTRSLLPLEKIGLVDRQSDPRDARVGYAIITPTGSELVTNATTVVDNISRAMLGAPSKDQLQATSNLLAQLAGVGQ